MYENCGGAKYWQTSYGAYGQTFQHVTKPSLEYKITENLFSNAQQYKWPVKIGKRLMIYIIFTRNFNFMHIINTLYL